MQLGRQLGNFFHRAIAPAAIAMLVLALGGCNFFGKQTDENTARVVGQLGSGTSILGTWVYSSFDSNNAGDAFTDTITFEPSGNFRMETRGVGLIGGRCTAYGQFRTVGLNDVLLYLQAQSSGECGYEAQYHFTQVEVSKTVFTFKYVPTGSVHRYNLSLPQPQTIAGIWGLNGSGGFNYILFDHHGYFVEESTIDGQTSRAMGFYVIVNASQLVMYYLDNGFPPQSIGALAFSQFITDGQNLILVHTDEQNVETNYTGTRL